MTTIYGQAVDGKYFGPNTVNGNTLDPTDIANSKLESAFSFPRDVIIPYIGVICDDPLTDSVNYTLRVDGEDTPLTLSVLAGETVKNEGRLNYIVEAGKLISLRTDAVGSPTMPTFTYSLDAYYV